MTSAIGLSANTVTNLFLYGTTTRPADMLDPDIAGARADASVSVSAASAASYMTSGPGRFASPVLFPVVQSFFAGVTSPPPKYNQSGVLVPYTESEMVAFFGLNQENIVIDQKIFADGTDDYAERVYIWNNTGFDIGDSAKFWVLPDGSKYISDFVVKPWGPPGEPENFDFKAGDGLTDLINPLAKNWVDPSGIGRKVNFVFDSSGLPTRTFTMNDWQASVQSTVYGNPLLLARIPIDLPLLIQEMFDRRRWRNSFSRSR